MALFTAGMLIIVGVPFVCAVKMAFFDGPPSTYKPSKFRYKSLTYTLNSRKKLR